MASLEAAERVVAWAAGETPYADLGLNELTHRSDSQVSAAVARTIKMSGIFDDWTPPLPDKTTQLTPSHEQAQGEQ